MTTRIGIAWPVKIQSGWGLLGLNLAIELQRTGVATPIILGPQPELFDPLLAALLRPAFAASKAERMAEGAAASATRQLPYPILHSVGTDMLRTPVGRPYGGAPDLAIVFIEHNVITSEGRDRGERYRLLIAGSQWNAELLRAAGLGRVVVWRQGVDLSRFHPAPARRLFPDRFVVFSGGALQLRKGQDIVVKAFREFHRKHEEALLITAWANPYIRYARTILLSPMQASPFDAADPEKIDLDKWLSGMGLPRHAFINLPLMGNAALPTMLRQADVALFPNRAEGGTNLVAMEAMACGIPCILSPGTGHRDLIDRFPCYPLAFRPFPPEPRLPLGQEGWCEASVDDVVAQLDAVHADRERARRIGAEAAGRILDWGWEKQVPRLLDLIEAHS
jgi:glycosyltransferase involved in cell wall biosynthesis